MKSLFGEGKGGYGSVPDGDEEKTSINPAKSTVEVILGEEGSKERELILHPTMREKEHKKITKLLDAATDRAPPAVVGYLKSAQPCVAGCVVGCEMCVPIYARVYALGARFVAALPQEELGMLLGLLLCFFGGLYPMTLAAVEALRQCGGAQFYEACHDLQVQFLNAKAASDADDLVDEDGDGVADVEQISAQSLAARKTMIVLRSTDPHTCDLALKGVYASLAAVARRGEVLAAAGDGADAHADERVHGAGRVVVDGAGVERAGLGEEEEVRPAGRDDADDVRRRVHAQRRQEERVVARLAVP